MSSTKRKLFSNEPADANAQRGQNGSTEDMVYTVVSEGDSLPKEPDSPCSLHSVNDVAFHASLNKDLTGKILVVGEGREVIQKQFANMKLPRSVELLGSSSGDLMSVCSKERFLLIFLDMSSKANNALKLCSTIRYNTNSQNQTVAIIGVTAEGRAEDYSSHGINDVTQLPLKEEAVHQLLLKWAGQTSCEGMPLTPESPDNEIALARKAAEIIKETEEHSFLSYHHHPPTMSSVNCDYPHPMIISDSQSKISAGPHPTYYTPPPSGITGQLSTDPTPQRTAFTSHPYPNSSGGPQVVRAGTSHLDTLPPIYQAYGRLPEHGTVQGPPSSCPLSIPAHGSQHRSHSTEASQYYHSIARPVGSFQGNPHHYVGITPTPHSNPPFGNCPMGTYSNLTPFKPAPVRAVTHSSSSMFDCLSPLSHLGRAPSFGSPAYMVSGTPGSKDMKITMLHDDLSKHSSKERIRRERIKDSCDKLRYLLPNISGKRNDMASILELTVKFVQAVNEKMSRTVWQEVSEKMSVFGATHSRKRSQKDAQIKQRKPRLGLLGPANQETSTKPSAPLGEEGCGPYRARAPTMVTTTGPMYLPHFHMGLNTHQGPGPVNPSNSLVPGRYTAPTTSTSIMLPKEPLGTQHHYPPRRPIGIELPPPLHKPDKGDIPPAAFRHHQQMYFSNPPPFPMTMMHAEDMPAHLNIAKLPPISSISACSSTTDLSQCSMDQESAGSCQSSPDSATITPPLWDTESSMTGSRDDLLHGHGSLSTYK